MNPLQSTNSGGQVETGLNAELLRKAGIRGTRVERALLKMCSESAHLNNVITAIVNWRLDRTSGDQDSWGARIEQVRKEYRASKNNLVGLRPVGRYETSNVQWIPGKPRPLKSIVNASSSPKWCRLLFTVARAIGARNALELGTCVGISTAYLAAALGDDECRVVSIEGAAEFSAQAGNTLEQVGLRRRAELHAGLIQLRLPEILATEKLFDFAFVDGHHDGLATVRYVDAIMPRLRAESVMVLDDIRWSDGMQIAWNQIRANPAIPITIDLDRVGLCVFAPNLEKLDFECPVKPGLLASLRRNVPVDHPLRRTYRRLKRKLGLNPPTVRRRAQRKKAARLPAPAAS